MNTFERTPCKLYIYQCHAFHWTANLHLSDVQLKDVSYGKRFRDGGYYVNYDMAASLCAESCKEDETILLLLCRDLGLKKSRKYKLKIG